jgi:hypothetical protein
MILTTRTSPQKFRHFALRRRAIVCSIKNTTWRFVSDGATAQIESKRTHAHELRGPIANYQREGVLGGANPEITALWRWHGIE